MKVQVKDLTDEQVIRAIELGKDVRRWPNELLPFYPEKVVHRKMEQMSERGLIEYGVSLRSAWVVRCEDCGAVGHYNCDRPHQIENFVKCLQPGGMPDEIEFRLKGGDAE